MFPTPSFISACGRESPSPLELRPRPPLLQMLSVSHVNEVRSQGEVINVKSPLSTI